MLPLKSVLGGPFWGLFADRAYGEAGRTDGRWLLMGQRNVIGASRNKSEGTLQQITFQTGNRPIAHGGRGHTRMNRAGTSVKAPNVIGQQVVFSGTSSNYTLLRFGGI